MLTLYSTHCPKCEVLETKLKNKGLDFEIVDDVATMESKGFDYLPMLESDDVIMDFHDAIQYINKLGD